MAAKLPPQMNIGFITKLLYAVMVLDSAAVGVDLANGNIVWTLIGVFAIWVIYKYRSQLLREDHGA